MGAALGILLLLAGLVAGIYYGVRWVWRFARRKRP